MGQVFNINDGSGTEYDNIFELVAGIIIRLGGVVLKHDVNRGKGRALKIAFHYILNNYSDVLAVVTADSDGQYNSDCPKKDY